MKQHKRLWAGVIFLMAGILFQMAARFMDGFSQWYVSYIYPVLVGSLGRLFGLFSFSVVEIILYLVIVLVVVMIFQAFRKKRLYDLCVNVFLMAAVLFFLYCSNCGVNYYRTSFAESEGLNSDNYSIEELVKTCRWLTKEVNDLSSCVKRDEDGVMCLTVNELPSGNCRSSMPGSFFAQIPKFHQQKLIIMHYNKYIWVKLGRESLCMILICFRERKRSMNY